VTWQLVLSGFLIGTLVGLTGMGGGSLMTPLLVIVFGFKPTVAIGTDIVHGALFKTVGAIRHRQLGNVQARLSGWMFLGSAPTSLLGVALATWLKHRYGDSVEAVTGRMLGTALVFGGVGLFAKNLLRPNTITGGLERMTNRDRVAAILIGLFGGFIVGLTSVGSGTFFGLTMLILFPLGAQKMVGTDIFHAAALLYVAGAAHLVAGNVALGVVGWLLLGSIPGVLLGSQWSIRLPEAVLRGALATMLMLAGMKLVAPSETSAMAAVAVGVGLAGLLAYGLLRSRPGTKPSPGTAKPNARPRNRLGLPSDIPATVPVSRDR
jgi:uncharacterized membrane protein YfcA